MNTPRTPERDALGSRSQRDRRSRLSDADLAAARQSEIRPRAYGRAARRLLEEVDSYLEFFAIARAA